jgi:hypothetical protein
MDHHNDVSACIEGLAVTRLLIAPISVIFVMDKGVHPELFGEKCSVVIARIVDKNFDINDARQCPHGFLQSSFRVIGRHHDRYPFSVDHRFTSWFSFCLSRLPEVLEDKANLF